MISLGCSVVLKISFCRKWELVPDSLVGCSLPSFLALGLLVTFLHWWMRMGAKVSLPCVFTLGCVSSPKAAFRSLSSPRHSGMCCFPRSSLLLRLSVFFLQSESSYRVRQ